MFGIEALDVVIGMIFIYLLFSLFVSITELKTEIDSLRTIQIDRLISSLGLGWEKKQRGTLAQEISDVISKPVAHWKQNLGWLKSVLALSLGAPFWFDLIKKIVNVKNEITKK